MLKTKQLLTGVLAMACVGLAQGATLTSVGTTGVFDENVGATNSIDLDPTGQLAAFKAAVAAAYANNTGGVIDWEAGVNANGSSTAPGDNFAANTPVSVTYGVSGTQSLDISFDRQIALYSNNVANQVSVLSSDPVATNGNNAILSFTTNTDGLAFGVDFSAGSVIEIGAGMLARSTFDDNGASVVNFQATATFSDSTTSVLNYSQGATLGDGTGASDTFIHFVAPTGQTIDSLFVTWVSETGGTALTNGKRRPVMDDLGFILVPEPSSLALLGLGGLLVARRRRQA